MRFTIADVGKFFQGAKSPLSSILQKIKSIFNFEAERKNRLRRAELIMQAYASGRPLKEIEEKYECSRGTILRYARAAGLEKRGQSARRLPAATRATALLLLKEKKPLAEISARLGVSEAWLSLLAKEHNLSRYKRKKI